MYLCACVCEYCVCVCASTRVSVYTGTAALADIKGGAQEHKIAGGAQQLSDRLAAGLGAGAVQLGSPVVRIRQTMGQGVQVETTQGGVWRAAAVVVALPPPLAHSLIQYEVSPAGALPPIAHTLRARVAARMPMGSIIKVLVFYPRPFWRDAGLSGQVRLAVHVCTYVCLFRPL
jgi:monoamine oxidase